MSLMYDWLDHIIFVNLNNEIMYSVIFKGWNEGFKKITFTHLLREKAGLSPTQAKIYLDAILDGITIRVECASKEMMFSIQKEAAVIGAICETSEK